MRARKEPSKSLISNSLSEEERLRGWLLYNQLLEQVQVGNIGKAYLWKEELMRAVQDEIMRIAPQGVSSQEQFADTIAKAIQAIDKEQRVSASHEAEMADIELTLNMIERTLRMIPHQIFFSR